MNYFEFYDLPESFFPDQKKVKEKFYEYSRKFHPDFHATAEPEKQREVLELSTLNTNAFKTLSNFENTLTYILESYNLIGENIKSELPPAFLMNVMELNEQLMELEFEFDADYLNSILESLNKIWESLENNIKPLFEAFENQEPEGKKEILEKIKIYYLKRKYLLRIKETLATFADRF